MSAASCARSTCSTRASSSSTRGESAPSSCARSRTRRSPRSSSSSRTWACKSITDGEFRRTYFHIDFLEQLGGVKTDIPVTIRKPDGTEELAPPVMRVIDKVRHVKDIQRADFEYLKSQVAAGLTPKVTIPSPDHAALPRRPRRHQPRRPTPSSTRCSTTTWPRPTARSCRSLVRRRLPLRADGRHQPGLPVRREDARGGAPARRRPQRAAAPLRRRSSTRWWRTSPPA